MRSSSYSVGGAFCTLRALLLAPLLALLIALPPLARAAETTSPSTDQQGGHARLLIQSSPLAGSQFHALPAVVDQIRVGDPLTLQREPGNPHDSYAIQVLWHDHMLGYVPRRENRAIARALDQQMPLDARVVALRPDETPWKRLRFEISMPLEPDH